ncbi:hypothetical protein GCM10010399_08870 [Dactylosporangium fulvum]|uniref:KOW domain-containing protein n=1 Tax=Dactylosporangium fulvum TaxID=53359 RepID=A0ABY5WBX8_9ACTN|nr:hypothetical protein [Dactylosporangium fulvum]UWP86719.1 hypothetical protein Dfulv_21750 [Dactylosporangium fulvum]
MGDIEVVDGAFAGLRGTVLSQTSHEINVEIALFGRPVPVSLRPDQVRAAGAAGPAVTPKTPHEILRGKIVSDHSRLAGIDAFTFFVERVAVPEDDLASEWDAYLRRYSDAQTRARTLEQAALDRFDRELGGLPDHEAQAAIDSDEAYWHPARVLARSLEQAARDRPTEPTPELGDIARWDGEQPDDPLVLARERRDRAELAAQGREHEQWRASRSPDELRALPARGNPGRYAYAQQPHIEQPDLPEPPPAILDASPLFAAVLDGGAPMPADQAAALLEKFHQTVAEVSVAHAADNPAMFTRLVVVHQRISRTMVASRRLDVIQEFVRHETRKQYNVVGLLLAGGVGDVAFPSNPWGIPATAGLTEALRLVWAPIAVKAPKFVAAAHHRTLALALLTGPDGDVNLGYVTWWRYDDHDEGVPPTSLDSFAAADSDSIDLVVGAAPHLADPTIDVPSLAGPAPRPIRDLWAVHHRLAHTVGDGIGGDLGSNILEWFADESWQVAGHRIGDLPPDRFVSGPGASNYETYVFDLDELDPDGNPMVGCWDNKQWQIYDRKPYWRWLNTSGAGLVWRWPDDGK